MSSMSVTSLANFPVVSVLRELQRLLWQLKPPTSRRENGQTQEYHTELEEAIFLTGIGKFHYVLLLSCGIALSGITMETFGVSFLLPSAQCEFSLSSADKGLLNALYPIGMICGSHTWGYLADTQGRKIVLVASLALDGLCAVLSSFSHALWLLLTFRFLCGFIIVGASSVVYAFFGEFHSVKTRSKGLMWLSIFIGVGIGVQPGIAWLIIPQTWEWPLPWCVYKSWRLFIVVCSLPNIISAILMSIHFTETPKFLLAHGKKDETMRVLKYMYTSNSGNSPDKYPVKSVILIEEDATQIGESDSGSAIIKLVLHMWNQTVPLFKPPFLWKTLLACTVQFGLYASTNGLSLWFPDIFNHQAIYFTHHPNSYASLCQIYNVVQEPIYPTNLSQYVTASSIQDLKSTALHLQENDTLTFSCENSTVILSVNNYTSIPLKPSPNVLKCDNGILLHNISDSSLQIDVQKGEVILTVLNTYNTSYIPHYEVENILKEPINMDEMMCNSDIDMSAFQNTLIVGAVCAVSYICVGFLMGHLGKKKIIMSSLICGGIAGLFLDYVNSNWEFFVMSLIFVTLSGMCITVMVSVVVDIFPTNFRAMAVCLSLMCGRLGSFTAHMLMGILLETNCIIMTYLLGGICITCGLLSALLPSTKNKHTYS